MLTNEQMKNKWSNKNRLFPQQAVGLDTARGMAEQQMFTQTTNCQQATNHPQQENSQHIMTAYLEKHVSSCVLSNCLMLSSSMLPSVIIPSSSTAAKQHRF